MAYELNFSFFILLGTANSLHLADIVALSKVNFFPPSFMIKLFGYQLNEMCHHDYGHH